MPTIAIMESQFPLINPRIQGQGLKRQAEIPLSRIDPQLGIHRRPENRSLMRSQCDDQNPLAYFFLSEGLKLNHDGREVTFRIDLIGLAALNLPGPQYKSSRPSFDV